MKANELVEVSQDREAWRELVVACVDLQPPDERERDMAYNLYHSLSGKRGFLRHLAEQHRRIFHLCACVYVKSLHARCVVLFV